MLDYIKKEHNFNAAFTPVDILSAVTNSISAAINFVQEALKGTITTLVNSTLCPQMQDNQMEISVAN